MAENGNNYGRHRHWASGDEPASDGPQWTSGGDESSTPSQAWFGGGDAAEPDASTEQSAAVPSVDLWAPRSSISVRHRAPEPDDEPDEAPAQDEPASWPEQAFAPFAAGAVDDSDRTDVWVLPAGGGWHKRDEDGTEQLAAVPVPEPRAEDDWAGRTEQHGWQLNDGWQQQGPAEPWDAPQQQNAWETAQSAPVQDQWGQPAEQPLWGQAEQPWGAGDQWDDRAPVALAEDGRGGGGGGGRSKGGLRKRTKVLASVAGIVVLALVGGAFVWSTMDMTVQLTVDGEVSKVSTRADTVAALLQEKDYAIGDHDVIAPPVETKLDDGAEVTFNRGRLLKLTVDGKPRQVWVTATSVDEALNQIGFKQTGLYVSASRSGRLPLTGMELEIRTPKRVTVVADGGQKRLTTTAAAVGDVLGEAKITVDGDDRVSQLSTAAVVDGMTITVTRVLTKRVTVRAVLKYDTVEKKDGTLVKGETKVSKEGVNGLQDVTYVATYEDGRLKTRKIVATRTVRPPVTEVVQVGTKEKPANQPAECADFPTLGGLNWCGLAQCESGLNPQAVNPAGPYLGLYQFDQGTWEANGGTGSPTDASVEQQTQIAFNLFQARGRSPWPVCGSNL